MQTVAIVSLGAQDSEESEAACDLYNTLIDRGLDQRAVALDNRYEKPGVKLCDAVEKHTIVAIFGKAMLRQGLCEVSKGRIPSEKISLAASSNATPLHKEPSNTWNTKSSY